LGTFSRMSGYRDAYYLKALKARSALMKEYFEVFKHCDVVCHPTMPFVAPRFSDIKKLSPMQNYAADLCTVPANLGGFPHLSIPVKEVEKLPVGLMLTGKHFDELSVAEIGKGIESVVNP